MSLFATQKIEESPVLDFFIDVDIILCGFNSKDSIKDKYLSVAFGRRGDKLEIVFRRT